MPQIRKKIIAYVASIAMISLIFFWIIGYFFFFPAWNVELKDVIVPDTAIRLSPQTDEEVPMLRASDRLWYVQVYNVPDMSPEEAVDFYEDKRFQCEFWEEGGQYLSSLLENSLWVCGRSLTGPRSDGINISGDPNGIHDGSIIMITTDFRTWD